MADLESLFEQAETELPGLKRRRTKTQEVLELAGVQGVAWRPLRGTRVLQINPPTKGRETFREGGYLVVKSVTSECRYYDPNHNLRPNQWSFVGCSCSNLSNAQVWGWIKQAYENLKRDKTMCSKHLRGEINIEEVRSMGTKKLMVDIPEELHDRFFEYVINKFKAKPEPGYKAINTAVEIALTDFLERMEKGGDKGNQE